MNWCRFFRAHGYHFRVSWKRLAGNGNFAGPLRS
jgi:hypothetical protein